MSSCMLSSGSAHPIAADPLQRPQEWRDLLNQTLTHQGGEMAAQPRIRKNIDSLTPDELADFEHAFAKIKEISDADPDSIDGLQYFTDLHNTMLGPCEHA